MFATVEAPTTVAARVEAAANTAPLVGDGFQEIANGSGLVMGTPTALITTVAYAAVTVSQWSTVFFVGGSADRDFSADKAAGVETPSLEDLVRLYES